MGAAAFFSRPELLDEVAPEAGAARRIEQNAIGSLDRQPDIIRCLNNGIIGDDPFHREAGGHQQGLQIGGGFRSRKIKHRTFLRIKFRGRMSGKPLHIAAMGLGKFETIFLCR